MNNKIILGLMCIILVTLGVMMFYDTNNLGVDKTENFNDLNENILNTPTEQAEDTPPTPPNYEIIDDKVILENDNAKLTVYPHTVYSLDKNYEQNFILESKIGVSKDICIGYVFDEQLTGAKIYAKTLTQRPYNLTTYECTETQILPNSSIECIEQTPTTVTKYETVEDYIDRSQFFNHVERNGKHIYYSTQAKTFNALDTFEWKIKYNPPSNKGKWDLYAWNTLTGDCMGSYLDENDRQFLYHLDPWFSDYSDWTKKKQIEINSTVADIANYTILLNITYDSDMNSDFSDIRFSNSTDDGALYYWFKDHECIDGVNCEIFVNIGTLTNKSIYMYYGNAVATNESNIQNAFWFGEDFLGTSINTSRWGFDDGANVARNVGNGELVFNVTAQAYVEVNNYKILYGAHYGYEMTSYGKQSTEAGDYIGFGISTDDSNHYPWMMTGKNTVTNPNPSYFSYNAGHKSTDRSTDYTNYVVKTVIWNATGGFFYDNWVFQNNLTSNTPNAVSIMSYRHHSNTGTRTVDWVYLRPISNAPEIVTYYSEESANENPVVYLVSPADDTNYSSNDVNFVCNTTDDVDLGNVTLYGNFSGSWLANETATINGTENSTTFNIKVPYNNSYIWNCYACDDTGLCSFATSNYTFEIEDEIINLVSVTLNEPNDSYETVENSILFNCSASYISGLVNLTLVIDGNDNFTVYNSSIENLSLQTTQPLTIGAHNWTCRGEYLNDTGTTAVRSLTIQNYIINSETYNDPVYETALETFAINFTHNAGYTNANTSFYYNGTKYTPTQVITGDTVYSSVSLYIPSVTQQTEKNIFWSIDLDSLNFNTTANTQTILKTTDISIVYTACAGGMFTALSYNFSDEVNGSGMNSDVEYNFKYGVGNFTSKTLYGGYNNISTLNVCINASQSNYSLGYGEVKYSSVGYVTRNYYMYYGFTLVNDTTYNYTLYDLESSQSTSFKLEVEDRSLNPYANIYTRLLRWYPSLNEYKTVEMGNTDENGATVIHVEAEDVDYRIGAYYLNGSLIKLADPSRMICLVNPCTYTLKVSLTDNDYTSFLGVDSDLDFNETTGLWSYVFSDETGITQNMNLTVYRMTPTSTNVICSSTVAGASGAISCNTSGYTGLLKGVVTRTASPATPIASLLREVGANAFKSTWGLFMILLLMIPIMFIFVYVSPVYAIAGGVITLYVAYMFGTINIGVLLGFVVMGGIILHFISKKNG